MNKKKVKGRWALVTGASSGFGVDFARQLGAWGVNLILTARRQEVLEQLAQDLRTTHGVDVRVMACDLSVPNAPETLATRIKEDGLVVDILINNAGFGAYGPFDQIPWEKENTMLQLDIVALTRMTKIFAGEMKKRHFGLILQVASIGAYQPSPLYAAYSAAKAYVLSYGVAVNQELRKTGVSSTVLSPGVTATGFLDTAGQKPTLYQRLFMMKSPDVVRIGLKALIRRRWQVVPGFLNALMAFSIRFISRPMAARTAEGLMK